MKLAAVVLLLFSCVFVPTESQSVLPHQGHVARLAALLVSSLTAVVSALQTTEPWIFFAFRTTTSALTATTLRAMTTRWLSGAWVWMMRATAKESSSPRAPRSHDD